MKSDVWVMGTPNFECDEICPQHKSWPWNGHRLFGYDLVSNLQPDLIVELGTYWGTSFFTFCQALKDHGLNTKCVAIDTWAGDAHTGDYDDEVYTTVQRICNSVYPGVNSELMRMYFQDAIDSFADKSIDILHIDGLHTYDAVKEDHLSWLPKLSEDGVILFHDISDSCDYGSVRYWKELSAQFPSYTFQHSWGLGVLFPKGRSVHTLMENNNFADKREIYEHRSELTLTRLQLEEMTGFNQQQDNLIKTLEKQVADQEVQIAALNQRLQSVEGSRMYRLLHSVKRRLF